jgi:S-DNA-T family DNA segregation ATPase FtsK/SpoIIIE
VKYMANRETGQRATRQKSASSRSTKSKSTRKGKKQPRSFAPSLRPEHQRDLFALALITIALVTLTFFFTGTTGGIGSVYVLGMQQIFGGGALVVPLALGALGVAIMIQERLHDTPLTGSSVLGIFLVLLMLLALLEVPVHPVPYEERFGEGGGLVGYWLVNGLDASIGRPATLVVVLMLLLAGLLLTFNFTLRELIVNSATALSRLWDTVWSPGEPQQAPARREKAAAAQKGAQKESLAFEAPPDVEVNADGDLIPTPIAARLTRASLFKRGQQNQPTPPTPEKETKIVPAEQPAAQPEASAPRPAKKPAPEPAKPAPERAKDKDKKPEEQPAPEITENAQETLEGFDMPVVYRAWPLPTLDLLEGVGERGLSDEEADRTLQARSLLIEETLASFKVEAQVVGVNPGPAVTQFEVQPAVGVKISKITSLEKDLALALAAPSIRIEAPIPGKSAVGIEIPNSAIDIVSLREVIDSEEFDANKGKLKLPLGKDIGGNPSVADMSRMPHLLVAGSTGSGKSVAINAFLCGLLLKHTPEELKLIMVDPKMVELIVYNRIPHLLSPVVTELERVVPTLKWATREMERRYKVFARHGCRNLESYKKMALRRADLEPMPYILIVIDELADLMMMAPDEIETYICRLAQMARATGIHLIIATQRPSVDVITGLIKANFPSRIAFAVTSQTDSRVILDTPGAERLLGRGDMLYMAADAAKLIRIQGTFVSDREVEQLVDFWRRAKPPEPEEHPAHRKQQQQQPQQPPERQEEQASEQEQGGEQKQQPERAAASSAEPAEMAYQPPAAFLSGEEQDELLPQAVELVQQHRRASASLLQRRLRIGYSKAAQLIDLLEQEGVVGPAEGGRSREVLGSREPGES